MSEPTPSDTLRGYLDTIIEIASNDLPADGPGASIIEQAEAARAMIGDLFLGARSLDLPFEETPGPVGVQGLLKDSDAASGVVVLAAALELDGRNHPVVIFRFSKGDGTFHRDMTLVTERDQLNKLPTLVSRSVTAAIRATR